VTEIEETDISLGTRRWFRASNLNERGIMKVAFVFLVTLALSLTACKESVVPTDVLASDGPAAAPRFGFTNGPANPGESGILRVEGEGGIGFFISTSEFIGLFWSDDSRAGCRAVSETATWELQQNLSPEEIEALFKTETVFVTIFDASAGPPSCALPIVAEGIGSLVYTDNDLLADVEDERTNAFGVTSEGTLALTGGGCATYNAYIRFATDGPGQPPVAAGLELHPTYNTQC
jgi:hypothetical protein